MVTVPFSDAPPTTVVDANTTDVALIALAVSCSTALTALLPWPTVMVADVGPLTDVVQMLKVVEMKLPGTVTLVPFPQRNAAGELLLTGTTSPPLGALPFMLSVTLTLAPPTTLFCANVIDDGAPGTIVTVDARLAAPAVSVTATGVDTSTGRATAVICPLVVPPVRKMLVGDTVSFVLSDDALRLTPAAATGPSSVKLPLVDDVEPIESPASEVGFIVNEANDGARTCSDCVDVFAPRDAVMVTAVFVSTGITVIGNVAVV
jgi:hypothetical protein